MQKLPGIIATIAIMSFILARGILTVADTDLWGHLRFGLDILRLSKIPMFDIYGYSYLVGKSIWINHEWLSEAIFALLYKFAGVHGLLALKLFCVVTISLLLWRSLLTSGFGLMAAAVILLIVEIFLAPSFIPLRPNLLTCLFFTVELLILQSYSLTDSGAKNQKYLFLLPFLFLIWANAHGGFILGLLVLIIWLVSSLIEACLLQKQWKQLTWDKPLLVVVLLSMAATTLNPYGIKLISFLLKTTSIPRPDITEWQPLKILTVYGIYYLLVTGLAVLSFIFSRKKKNLPTVSTWCIMALAPEVAYRLIPLFGIASVILAGPHMADCFNRLYRYVLPSPRLYWTFWTVSTAVVLFSTAGAMTQLSGIPGQITLPDDIPIKAVRLIQQAKIHTNALVEFAWAEYCIWHLGPDFKVAIDGRRETIYPDAVYRDYLHFAGADRLWNNIVEKYPTELVLIRPEASVTELMKHAPGWVLVYSDCKSCIFVRLNSLLQQRLSHLVSTEPKNDKEPLPVFP